MTTAYVKPLPAPANEELSRPFWEATRRHRLIMPRCNTCGNVFFYPREVCPICWAPQDRLVWQKLSGKGRVFSYTTVFQPAIPAALIASR